MTLRRLAPAIAATIALGGCLGERTPIPTAATVTPPLAWRTPITSQAPIDADWWRAFGDPNLDGLVQQALSNNADVDRAAASVAEARAKLRAAQANRGPEIDFLGLGGYTRQLEVTGPVDTWGAEPVIAAGWDLDLFGRLANTSAAARAQLLSTKASRDAVALGTASTTASTYISLLGLDEQLRIAQETVAARAGDLHIEQRRADRGYTSQLELRQAEAEYRSAQALVPQLQLSVSEEEDALSVLLGTAPAPISRAQSKLGTLATPAIPAGLPSDLLRRRPDIYAAEEAVVAADRSLDSARAEMLPQFSLTGNVGDAFAPVLPTPESFYLIGVSALAPIFDSGRRHANAEAAAAKRDEAAFSYRTTALKAFQEVEDTLASIQRLDERRQALARAVDADAAVLKVATERYEDGYSSYINKIDAQRSLLSAQLDLTQVETDRLLAFVTLYEAMGGGWSQNTMASSTFLANNVADAKGSRGPLSEGH
jgi:outer membrane protein, multidrug efflux system